jgi:probable metal-binding protein
MVSLPPTIMSPSITVSGFEIIDFVSLHPEGIRLSQLSELITKRYGASITFHTSSRLGLDFDDLLVFLEARNKLRVVRGVVFPAGAVTTKS